MKIYVWPTTASRVIWWEIISENIQEKTFPIVPHIYLSTHTHTQNCKYEFCMK